MVELAHSVPGRLRIRIPGIQRDQRLAGDARATILSIPAVTGVAANIVTGSVIITYDARELSPTALWDEVRCRLGITAGAALSDSGPEHVPAPGAEWIDQAARAAVDAFIGKMVEHAAVALVRAVI